MNFEIRKATSPEDLVIIKELFKEYEQFLQTDLCFQSFKEELENLPGAYTFPDGAIWLALSDGQPAGCVALKRHSQTASEMKRLFVKSEYQGHKIGRQLIDLVIKESIQLGYDRIKLDVLPKSESAIKLYHAYGFKPTVPYYTTEQVVYFFELEIR
jgi:ribosomal protein S18 acetylase RimI-like enzyme